MPGVLLVATLISILLFWLGQTPFRAEAGNGHPAQARKAPENGQILIQDGPDSSFDPLEGKSIQDLIPDLTAEDLAFLRSERPRYERVNAVYRLKGQGKLEAALAAARASVEADPGFGPAIDAYVEIAEAGKKLEAVGNWFEGRTKEKPVEWMGWYGLAKARLAQKAGDEGLEPAQRAVQEGCDYWGCMSAVASAYQGLKKVDEGVAWFRALAQSAKGDRSREGLAWLGLGDLLDDDGAQWKEAEEALQRTTTLLRPGRGWEQAKSRTAGLLGSLGQLHGSLKYRVQALAVFLEVDDRRCGGTTLVQLGYIFRNLSDGVLAIDLIKWALAMCRETGDRRCEGEAHWNLGGAYRGAGDLTLAIKSYGDALVAFDDVEDQRFKAKAVVNLGAAYVDLGEVTKGLNLEEQAIALFRAIGDRRSEGMALLNIAVAYGAVDEFSKALTFTERALTVCREVQDRQSEGLALGNLGALYRWVGELARGIWFSEQALRVFQEVGHRRGEANVLADLGRCYIGNGKYSTAIGLFEQALTIVHEMGTQRSEVDVLMDLGNVYRGIGEAYKAIGFYEKALTIVRGGSLRYRQKEGELLGEIGSAYRQLGRAPEAIGFFEQAQALHRELGSRESERRDSISLAGAQQDVGDRGAALRSVARSLELTDSLTGVLDDPEFEASYFAQSANAHALEVRLLTSALPGSPAPRLTTDILARTFAAGEEARARSFHRRLQLASIDPRETAPPEALGKVRETTFRLNQARDFLNDAAPGPAERYALRTWLEAQLAPYHERHVVIGSALPQPAQALERQRAALEAGTLAAEDRRTLLRSMYEAREEEAAAAERALRDATPAYKALVEPRLASLEEVQQSLDEHTVLIAYLLGEDESFAWAVTRTGTQLLHLPPEKEISQQVAEFRAMLTGAGAKPRPDGAPSRPAPPAPAVKPATGLVATRGSNPTEATGVPLATPAVEPATGLVATRGSNPPEATPGTPAAPAALSAGAAVPPKSTDDKAAHAAGLLDAARALTRTLGVDQALETDAGATHLVVVADGSLGALPFEALVRGNADAARTNRAAAAKRALPPWLGLRYAIAYAPSVTVWWQARMARRALPTPAVLSGPLLLVADPVYHDDPCGGGATVSAARGTDSRAALFDETWNRLCFAPDEARAILRARRRGLLPRRDDVILSGATSSEAGLRKLDLEHFSILHFATHALAHEDVPLRSAIVLSQAPSTPVPQSSAASAGEQAAPSVPNADDTIGDATDGYLELREIVRLKLKADLVVLSACQTAEGRKRRGEGVESLARGFLMAGAKEVVASQWQVADQSTARFMARFYRELRAHTPEEALLRTRRAFVLGEERPVTAGRDGQTAPSDWTHPYYWAPFVLIEGSRPVSNPS